MRTTPVIHRFEASLLPVNAYIVEGREAVVAVDATLGVSDGHALRQRIAETGKPLAAVIVTHAHPDHYGAVTAVVEGTEVPVLATEGVDRIIRRDDEIKERILRPMFGGEWAARRTFPTRTVRGGDRVALGDLAFRVMDLGPGESPHDSAWVLDDESSPPRVFCGDLVVDHMHCYLADGFHEEWRANLRRAKRELPGDAPLYLGHGKPGAASTLLDWTDGYVRVVVDAVRQTPPTDDTAAFADAVTRTVRRYLPGDDLLFLMQLSIEPLRQHLHAA